MTVQALLQSLLVQEVSDESHTTTQDKQTIQSSVLDDIFSFIFGKESTKTNNTVLNH